MNYAGLYRGTVVDNVDPQARMRLKVNIQSTATKMAWAEACIATGSSATGNAHMRSASALPQVGSNVWVAFEGGNAERPVWVGLHPS